jgi:hypothetical protein
MAITDGIPFFSMPPKGAADYCQEIGSFLRRTPDAWCQGYNARAGDGRPLSDVHSPWARQFCAVGLVLRFISDQATAHEVMERLSRAVTPPNSKPVHPHIYNDQPHTTVNDIIAMFECAALMPRQFEPVPFEQGLKKFEQDMEGMATYIAEKALAEHAELSEAAAVALSPPPDWNSVAGAKSADEPNKKLTPWSSVIASIAGVAA